MSGRWITALVLILAMGLLYLLEEKNRLYQLQLASLQAQNKTYRNKNNELVSEHTAYQGTLKDLKGQVKNWEKVGDTLRSKLSAQSQQLILLTQQLSIAGRGQPRLDFPPDTLIFIAEQKIDSPSYVVQKKDAFHSFEFAGNQNVYAYQLKVFMTTELLSEDLGKQGIRVSAVSRNPYVDQQQVKALVVARPKQSGWQKTKNILLGAAIGAAVVGLK